ncbi:uncharacterized protein LOC111714302 isoform X3 [Eurytemora carolleeae]|uniref:uncharacterized protein LOC111714302 isoform X2 n=1 Tax=Eurytemora carolleeae TaxID=1294199 RepID=UPI000C77925B|nr:uncharacterized protein LOC111714302 isoform X2 [Eurytemora carolleeae]XP_023345149.1 uncharacterized protein LOC111714302 isoform X3 [Eurytemora carolleeae]|eukprot:XP_023345148.1 uncharacterized protein LOC111714302 isoform X2 [Eurytemora affinis]
MSILRTENGLENVDLTPAFLAVKQDVEISARFKKKEDIHAISKSILKHRIQTLTGRNIKKIEEEMNYKPVDINETGMNIDIMKKLAHCLILQANGELNVSTGVNGSTEPEPAKVDGAGVSAGRKRAFGEQEVPTPTVKKTVRRSLAVSKVTELDSPLPKRGRKSLATPLITSSTTPSRNSIRSKAALSQGHSSLDQTDFSSGSVAVRCLGPSIRTQEVVVEESSEIDEVEEEKEEEDEDENDGIVNPTPAMKELLKKRKSLGRPVVKSSPARKSQGRKPVKLSPVKPVKPAPAPPRPEFIGTGGTQIYLLAGEPLDLKLEKISKALPLSSSFPGAHLAVVHTPAEWTPKHIFKMTKQIKILNKSAGLDTFVVLMGTGLTNVHMNIDAMLSQTKHVQFVTFHREDANKDVETGKLRETTSFFLVGYFFPGCEVEGSTLPVKLVRDGYSTCFRTSGIEELENTIIDCFSEKDEWVLDLYAGKRKLTMAAAEKGRNGVVVHNEVEDLENLGDYLRTLALKEDNTYREEDGLVINI